MKKSIVFGGAVLGALLALVGCNGNRQETELQDLTHKFFYYVQECKYDSMRMIYPSINLQYTETEVDSLRFSKVKKLGKDRYELAFVRCYSPNNDENFTTRKNVVFTFKKNQKNDSIPFPYIIENSSGLVNPDLIPYYAKECGAIKGKYQDSEYAERLSIAEIIYWKEAERVAEYISEHITPMLYYDYIGETGYAWVNENSVNFALKNGTEYTCKGFTVYLTVDNFQYDVYHITQNGYYGSDAAAIPPYGSNRYRFNFSNMKHFYYKNHVTAVKVKADPQAIASCNHFRFTGTEYEEYVKKNGVGR